MIFIIIIKKYVSLYASANEKDIKVEYVLITKDKKDDYDFILQLYKKCYHSFEEYPEYVIIKKDKGFLIRPPISIKTVRTETSHVEVLTKKRKG